MTTSEPTLTYSADGNAYTASVIYAGISVAVTIAATDFEDMVQRAVQTGEYATVHEAREAYLSVARWLHRIGGDTLPLAPGPIAH